MSKLKLAQTLQPTHAPKSARPVHEAKLVPAAMPVHATKPAPATELSALT